MGFWSEAIGTAGDGLEMAGQFGLEAAEEVPLVSTAIHGGIGAYDAYEMQKHQHAGDAADWQAADNQKMGAFGADNPDQDAELQHEASKEHDEAQEYGHDAQSQFFQAIPLIGTAYGLGTLANKVIPDYAETKQHKGLFGEEI
jgi:hypothetical protein